MPKAGTSTLVKVHFEVKAALLFLALLLPGVVQHLSAELVHSVDLLGKISHLKLALNANGGAFIELWRLGRIRCMTLTSYLSLGMGNCWSVSA